MIRKKTLEVAVRLAMSLILSLLAARVDAVVLPIGSEWAHFADFHRAEAFLDDGIVHFRGAYAANPFSPPTSGYLFTLPPEMRPDANVYVAVDLCQSDPGRLLIETSGAVSVQPYVIGAYAYCGFSLDGAKFAVSASGATPLALTNGWVGAASGTRAAAARLVEGVVHLQGGVSGGSGTVLATLPVGMRPATTVYVTARFCSVANGRLIIEPSGTVSVFPLSAATQCLTSLDGVSFVPSDVASTPLALENGWTGAPFSTSAPAVSMVDGIVRFKGTIAGGTTSAAFFLPSSMRSAAYAYLPIDRCDGTPGRLVIDPSGVVSVSPFDSNSQCFTSLDGVSFVPSLSGFVDLPLKNGWVNHVYATATTAVGQFDGIVRFKGAVTSGADPLLFTLPVTMRPEKTAYVPVDLCAARPGRLMVVPSGEVWVQGAYAFSDAQCFVSLESASYAPTASGFAPLVLQNGWLPYSASTAQPGAIKINGIVHLRGAIRNGASSIAFTLPAGMRPATNVYLPIGLCDAAKGRLYMSPSGEVSVLPLSAASQCFTSLDGARFATSEAGFATLPRENGWNEAPYDTSTAKGTVLGSFAYLKGAIISGSDPIALTLPPVLRPPQRVYVPVDLINGAKGRLTIEPSGTVSVQAEVAWADAQNFTSLDGVSYAVPEPATFPGLALGTLVLAGLRRRGGGT